MWACAIRVCVERVNSKDFCFHNLFHRNWADSPVNARIGITHE
jgi:hypothetical protein